MLSITSEVYEQRSQLVFSISQEKFFCVASTAKVTSLFFSAISFRHANHKPAALCLPSLLEYEGSTIFLNVPYFILRPVSIPRFFLTILKINPLEVAILQKCVQHIPKYTQVTSEVLVWSLLYFLNAS